MRFHYILFVLLLNFWGAKALEVGCELIIVGSINVGALCQMDEKTEITSDDVEVSKASEDKFSLWFDRNRKISFLPIKVHEKMPNLFAIYGDHCSISMIGKKNFKNLTKLENVHLIGNKIERINSDTFEANPNLKIVDLEGNQIKFLNGKLFERKPDLNTIDLKGNVCINKRAKGTQEIQNMLPEITAQCEFDESNLLGINCGRGSYTSFVVGGNETTPGKWPILVALILATNGQYFCGGNLISSKHVLTAAHCLHDKNSKKQLEADHIVVLLGRHDLNARYERGSVQREVAEVILHPNWKNYTEKYDSDLAILVLERQVQFSAFIQPVCLTKNVAIMDQFDGTVVGWGKSESEAAHENIPRQVSIRAVTSDVCFEKDHNLGNIYSRTAFCAGGEGAGPCIGDSGGGFFVNFQGLWTLRGIVSAGTLKNAGVSCNVGRYTLFSKLVDFANWINENVERS